MNALIAEFSELFTPPAKGHDMNSLDRFIHPPSRSACGDAALRRFVYVTRADLSLGGGRIIPRGTVLEPGTLDDPHVLVAARKAWALDTEPLGFLLAALGGESARRSEPPEPVHAREAEPPAEPGGDTNQATPGHPTREPLRGARYLLARDWLAAELARGPRLASELYAEGDALLHSQRNIERACAELGVESHQQDRAWWKRLPESDRQPDKPYTPTRARAEDGE